MICMRNVRIKPTNKETLKSGGSRATRQNGQSGDKQATQISPDHGAQRGQEYNETSTLTEGTSSKKATEVATRKSLAPAHSGDDSEVARTSGMVVGGVPIAGSSGENALNSADGTETPTVAGLSNTDTGEQEPRGVTTANGDTQLVKKMRGELVRRDCGVCRDQSQPPKLLPCMHSICAGCLEQHIDTTASDGTFPCPICRRTIEKPANGAMGFEDNIYTDTSVRANIECQACGERSGSHKCLECRQIYCSACANVHVKMATSKSHHVTAAAKDELTNRPAPKTFCELHRGKKLGYHCSDCDVVICGRCVIERHHAHLCHDVTQVARQHRQELTEYLDSEDTGTKFVRYLEQQSIGIRKAKAAFQNGVVNERTKIEEQAQKMKEEIDKSAKTLLENLLERERGVVNRYDLANRESEAKLRWATGTVKTVVQILAVAGDAELVTKFPGMKKVLLDMRDQVLPTRFDGPVEATFVRGSPTADDLTRIIGGVEIIGPIKVNISATIELPSSNRATTPTISAISPISDAEAWVVYDNVAQIFDKYGDKGMALAVDDTVHDVAVHSGGNLIIACDSCLKCVSETQKLYELFPFKNKPSGVAVLKDGGIVITFRGAALVTIYNLDGKVLTELNVKKGGAKIIREPNKVALNSADDVYVSECSSSDIHIFSRIGRLKTTISAAGIIPSAMAFDGHGCLLLGDSRESVHVLTETGQYLQTLIPNKFKIISAVTCLGIDDAGDIWIGDSSGRVKIFYKLK